MKLGFDMRSRINLMGCAIVMFLQARINSAIDFRPRVRIHFIGFTVQIQLSCATDFNTIREIFLREPYQAPLGHEVNIILDLGSNIGASLIYFALRYPQARIYGFEPNPDLKEILETNISPYSNISISSFGISDHNGFEDFFVASHGKASSFIKRGSTHAAPIVAEVRTLDTVIVDIGLAKIDILKFDIEGAEDRVLSSSKLWNATRFVVGEIHYDLIKKSKTNFIALFKNYRVSLDNSNAVKQIIKAVHVKV